MTPFMREVLKAVATALAMAVLAVVEKIGAADADDPPPRS
jgi:hypothetical protein